MRGNLVKLIGVACVVVALIVGIRAWRSEPALDTELSARVGTAVPQRTDESRRAADTWTRKRSGARPGAESAPPARGSSDRETGQQPRRELPPAVAAGTDRQAAGASGHIASSGSAKDSAAPRLSHEDLPPAARRGEPEYDPDAEDEANADLVYDSGAEKVFDTTSRVELTDAGPVNRGAGTISFWIEPQWAAGSQDGANFVQIGETGLQIVKDGDMLRFQHVGSAEDGGGAEIGDWQGGEWRHVLVTWNRNTMSLYVDGGQIFHNTPPRAPQFGDAELFVGSGTLPNGAPTAQGNISYLTVLNRDASPDEVRQMFESGGRPHSEQ